MDTRYAQQNWNSIRPAFTLVELLVVITIIGILVSLITVAAIGALRTARQAAIKTEVEEINGAFETYKDKNGSYPPNLVIDDESPPATPEPATAPIVESQVIQDLKSHLRQAFNRNREPDALLDRMTGKAGVGNPPTPLKGGMTAAEAVVFWLGGFSTDPNYPLSGEGGPSYPITSIGDPNNYKLDPIESRKWLFPFKTEQLGPRADDGYFDASTGRYLEYSITINGTEQFRRINFWQYTPARSKQPILYFDVSRHPAAILSGGNVIGPYDPPAASDLNPSGELHAHALKVRSESATAPVPIQFANQGKFQILHCGIDDVWGAEILEKTSAHGVADGGGDPANPVAYLLYPTGPFTGDAADTVVNFVTQARLEDAQQ
jgi:prepilin-type N-terminal cleavage/methylation domain-containing protein